MFQNCERKMLGKMVNVINSTSAKGQPLIILCHELTRSFYFKADNIKMV